MQKNIKVSTATNNYAEINTMRRYIRHSDHCQLVTKGNLWIIITSILKKENYKTRTLGHKCDYVLDHQNSSTKLGKLQNKST